jgi:hypothetical protein
MVLCCVAATAPASADGGNCQDLAARLDALGMTGDPEQLKDLYVAAGDLGDCDVALTDAVRDAVADAYAARGERGFRTGADSRDVESDFRQSLVYRQDWHMFERLGDLAMVDLEYATASISFLYAIHTIANETITVEPPPSDEIDRVLRKFSAVWSVADFYERPLPILIGGPQSRKWHRETSWASALGVDPLRGYAPAAPLLAVTFQFASPELTRHASETLVILKSLLDRAGSPTLRLAGYAGNDERENNAELDLAALSVQRAEAVQSWFAERNYKGEIVIETDAGLAPLGITDGLDLPPRVLRWFARRVDYQWDVSAFLPDGSDAR